MIAFCAMIDSDEDKLTFEQLYQKYKNLVYYIANERLKDTHLSEDVVQDTFIQIAKNMEKFQDVSSKRTKNLIACIANGKAIDLIRSRKNLHFYEESNFIGSYIGNQTTNPPLEQVIQRENYNLLLQAISQMDETDKTILQFRYIYQFSSKESAKLLGITYKAATNQLYRAKQKLATFLDSMQEKQI